MHQQSTFYAGNGASYQNIPNSDNLSFYPSNYAATPYNSSTPSFNQDPSFFQPNIEDHEISWRQAFGIGSLPNEPSLFEGKFLLLFVELGINFWHIKNKAQFFPHF